ncbi:MAG: biopolymer transporter ExbD, partial [Chitinophagaceae bacterium]|nr:biopolymer transporter ExbD [Chitinophagaceae bacterium]
VKVGLPKGTKDTKAKQDIMVSIDKDQQYSIGNKRVPSDLFDSLLSQEIRRYRAIRDTPVVVINADTSAFYGEVFRVMRIAKRDSAKVVAKIEQ